MRPPRVKRMSLYEGEVNHISDYPNFSATGNIAGMRRIYGQNALLVRCGSYIYHVPEVIYNAAH